MIATGSSGREKRLVAYVVPKSSKLQASELKAWLGKTLPSYAVPSSFVFLEKLPINTHGKVDRSALPEPEVTSSDYVQPTTELEKKLASMWETVLSVEKVGVKDNFFELGGSSLKAVQLFSLIEEELAQKIPLTALLEAPTPARLAKLLKETKQARSLNNGGKNGGQSSQKSPWDSLVSLQPNGTQPALFLLHAVGPSILNYKNLLPYLTDDRPVYALQAQGLDEKQPLLNRMDQMATRYIQDIKKIQPHGPYHLVGHSFGGLMAFEMAQQLQRP